MIKSKGLVKAWEKKTTFFYINVFLCIYLCAISSLLSSSTLQPPCFSHLHSEPFLALFFSIYTLSFHLIFDFLFFILCMCECFQFVQSEWDSLAKFAHAKQGIWTCPRYFGSSKNKNRVKLCKQSPCLPKWHHLLIERVVWVGEQRLVKGRYFTCQDLPCFLPTV